MHYYLACATNYVCQGTAVYDEKLKEQGNRPLLMQGTFYHYYQCGLGRRCDCRLDQGGSESAGNCQAKGRGLGTGTIAGLLDLVFRQQG